MDNILTQGIAAAKLGDREKAYQILTRATQDAGMAEHAWLWLSGVVEQDSERLFCLDNVLRINSNNEPARRGSAMLRQKGIFPSTPMPPIVQPAIPAINQAPPAPIKPTSISIRSSQPAPLSRVESPALRRAEPPPVTGGYQQDFSAMYKYVAMELANKKSPKALVKELTGRGISIANAEKIVQETEQAVRKTRGEKYKKRMIRGILWTVAGIVITCATISFAEQLGGNYVLCYGAIIFGVIDFLAGLIGWIFSG